jgi:hypothetical protein
MDVMAFLKTVPAAIGVAGLLTYLMSSPKPTSDLPLVDMLQNMRNTFVLLGCVALILLSAWLFYRPAPPDRDAALFGEHSLIASAAQPASSLLSAPHARPHGIFV